VLPNLDVWRALSAWWLIHACGANTPNWDLAIGCEIDERPGFVLVEAKANVQELSLAGKPLRSGASSRSRENHERIGSAIHEACIGLREFAPATAITRDSHYQLSNRAAYAWKLASLGVPTVLVYLGFIGDSGIANAGAPIRDDAHWRDVFAVHAISVLPTELFERRLDCGPAPTWFLVRSRPVLGQSPETTPFRPIDRGVEC
jgi:hypothetical protein